VGMGYLEQPGGIDDQWILGGEYQIDVEGWLCAAKVHLRAPYDPSGSKVRS